MHFHLVKILFKNKDTDFCKDNQVDFFQNVLNKLAKLKIKINILFIFKALVNPFICFI